MFGLTAMVEVLSQDALTNFHLMQALDTDSRAIPSRKSYAFNKTMNNTQSSFENHWWADMAEMILDFSSSDKCHYNGLKELKRTVFDWKLRKTED